ncbi:hypothetical protein BDV97DRAFT_400987 [Delphinella strobiligena]|nr:hypothetical protein BDV97DRAFT_400987 [Delphinella strobiligena]
MQRSILISTPKMPESDNDILLSLFVNLRNTAASFGAESKQYQSISDLVHGHLRNMQASGQKTDLTGAKQAQKDDAAGLAAAFEKLDLELKGQATEDEQMAE